MGTQERLIT